MLSRCSQASRNPDELVHVRGAARERVRSQRRSSKLGLHYSLSWCLMNHRTKHCTPADGLLRVCCDVVRSEILDQVLDTTLLTSSCDPARLPHEPAARSSVLSRAHTFTACTRRVQSPQLVDPRIVFNVFDSRHTIEPWKPPIITAGAQQHAQECEHRHGHCHVTASHARWIAQREAPQHVQHSVAGGREPATPKYGDATIEKQKSSECRKQRRRNSQL